MRPLFHPSIDDITVEGILHALSDPVRVTIYKEIACAECTTNCTQFINIGGKMIPKSTLSMHFKALRDAGLILGERQGVEMHNTSREAEIDQRFPGLVAAIVNAHTIQCSEKKAKPAAKKKKAQESR